MGDPDTSTHVVPSIEEAVSIVQGPNIADAGRPVYILATGSFRLVGGILTILEGEEIAKEPSTSMPTLQRYSTMQKSNEALFT